MKKHIMRTVLSLLIICMFTGCGEGEPEPSQEVAMEISTTEESPTEEASQEEQDSEEPFASEEPEIPELTEWDGTGELKKLNQRELGEYQYIGGKAYSLWKLPMVERTTGKYPGEARCEFFYMTDDTLFYMEDDGTVLDSPYESKSTYLFAQPLQSNGDDVLLLDENVLYAVYQDGIIMYDTYDRFKQKDVSTGELLLEFNFEDMEEEGYVYTYEKDYMFYYSADEEQHYFYYYEDQTKQPVYIPKEYKDGLWVWSGNIFSKQYNEDGTSNIIQLYEQCEPVWRIFPQKLPIDFDFSDGKAFYYDEETGVMEYDLETNRLRRVCDVEPDEYVDGKRHYTRAVGDNGAAFLMEGNSYNLYPNVFYYFVDEEGNKELIGKEFRS